MAVQTFNDRVSLSAARAIDEKIETEKEILAAGQLDFENYKKHTGIIQGLRDAKKLIVIADDEALKS